MQPHRFDRVVVFGLILLVAAGVQTATAQEMAPTYNGSMGGPPPGMPPIPGVQGYGVVPNAPVRPMPSSRPASWPGNPSPAASGDGRADWSTQPPATQQPLAPTVQPCEQAQTVAKAGSEVILVSDVLATLDDLIERNAGDKVPPDQLEIERTRLTKEVITAIDEAIAGDLARLPLSPEQEQRKAMLQQLLKQEVESKLVYHDAKTTIPAEHFPAVEKQLTKMFEETDVKKLMKRFGVESYRELDQALLAHGTSFEREKRAFIERNLAHEWLRQQVKLDGEITFDQIYGYYHQHSTEFDKPARTRWQELVVTFAEFPSKDEARSTISALGNRILAGEDFQQAAKSAAVAGDGSVHEWPDKSRTVSDKVQQAIEGLPTGQLSPLLEDWRGVHIVRVVERVPARHVPFAEAQPEIRDKIKDQRTKTQMQTYLNRLKGQIPVWTVLDQTVQVSERSGAPAR